VDEAGRGPLAGPVVAAAVLVDEGTRLIRGVDDSKVLTDRRREKLAAAICSRLRYAVGAASVREIDRLNILQATLLAMRRAIAALPLQPREVLVDGLYCPACPWPSRAIVQGDATVPEISAASIVAKCARDAAMRELHLQRPEYGFDRHKGYATPEHLAALRRHGPSEFHRRSFAPVRELLDQMSLF